jgi:hypothetical protein
MDVLAYPAFILNQPWHSFDWKKACKALLEVG